MSIRGQGEIYQEEDRGKYINKRTGGNISIRGRGRNGGEKNKDNGMRNFHEKVLKVLYQREFRFG